MPGVMLAWLLVVTILIVSAGWFVFDRIYSFRDFGPMLQDMHTNRVTIVWWQGADEPAGVVLRDPSGQLLRVPAQSSGSRYEANVQGLKPFTKYDYWLESESLLKRSVKIKGQFTTAPHSGTPFSFLVFGDSGDGNDPQYRLSQAMSRHPVSLILHTGDLVYRNGDFRDYSANFFQPYKKLIQSAPFYPVLGNHDIKTDGGSPMLEAFVLPENGPISMQAEHCYWFDYGDALFVGIDSNLEREILRSQVAPWLAKVLKTSRCKWKIVFFHHSPWAAGGRLSDEKIHDTLITTIEEGGADLVFSGHNHLYQRTHPMLAGTQSPEHGVIYITSGAGGKSLSRQKRTNETYLAAFNDSSHSFTRVQVNGIHLKLDQISENNMVLDSVSMEKLPAPRESVWLLNETGSFPHIW